MSVRRDHRRERVATCPDLATTHSNGDALPTCASGPLQRLSWTWHEIMDILRRR